MLTTSTVLLPPPTGALPERLSAGRPTDGDGVRLFTAEAAGLVWPDHSDFPPLEVDADRLRMPWTDDRVFYQLRFADGASLSPTAFTDPAARVTGGGGTAEVSEYARRTASYLLTLAGTAAHVAAVTDTAVEAFPLRLRPEQPHAWQNGTPVTIGSWQPLGTTVDPAALWHWSAADRAPVDGRRSGRTRQQVLDATAAHALAVAQALHDALQLLLPAAVPEPVPAPTNRRSTWR